MNKKDCIEKLEKEGITACETDGVVMVSYKEGNEREFKKFLSLLSEKIHSIGYTGSYGVKWKTTR